MITFGNIALKSVNLVATAIGKTIPLIRIMRNTIRPLEKDVAQFSGHFTPLERKLIEEVKQYGAEKSVETCRIIDKHGKEVTEFQRMESFGSVYLIPQKSWDGVAETLIGGKLGKKVGNFLKPIVNGKGLFTVVGKSFSILAKVQGGTYIHNHPAKLPLSYQDIRASVGLCLNKIIAVCPDGSTSCFANSPLIRGILDSKKNSKAYDDFLNSVSQKLKELQLPVDDTISEASPVKLEAMSKHQNAALQKLAKVTGGHYHTEGF